MISDQLDLDDVPADARGSGLPHRSPVPIQTSAGRQQRKSDPIDRVHQRRGAM
jgi:hypothetical protein